MAKTATKTPKTKLSAPSKLAVVTGASSGIGREMALELARHGYDVVLVARRQELLEQLAKEIEKNYKVKATPIVADLSNKEQLQKLSQTLAKHKVDLFINNAGANRLGNLVEMDPDAANDMLYTLINALTYLTVTQSQAMAKNGGGTIVNISSSVAYPEYFPGLAFYAAAKRYVTGLSKAANFENKKLNNKVRVVACHPGAIDTEFGRTPTKSGKKPTKIVHSTPPAEFARAVLKEIMAGSDDLGYGSMFKEMKESAAKENPEKVAEQMYALVKNLL